MLCLSPPGISISPTQTLIYDSHGAFSAKFREKKSNFFPCQVRSSSAFPGQMSLWRNKQDSPAEKALGRAPPDTARAGGCSLSPPGPPVLELCVRHSLCPEGQSPGQSSLSLAASAQKEQESLQKAQPGPIWLLAAAPAPSRPPPLPCPTEELLPGLCASSHPHTPP